MHSWCAMNIIPVSLGFFQWPAYADICIPQPFSQNNGHSIISTLRIPTMKVLRKVFYIQQVCSTACTALQSCYVILYING